MKGIDQSSAVRGLGPRRHVQVYGGPDCGGEGSFAVQQASCHVGQRDLRLRAEDLGRAAKYGRDLARELLQGGRVDFQGLRRLVDRHGSLPGEIGQRGSGLAAFEDGALGSQGCARLLVLGVGG